MDATRRFSLISWGITSLVVFGLLGFTYWRMTKPTSPAAPAPTPSTSEAVQQISTNALATPDSLDVGQAVKRTLKLKTNIPERPRFEVVKHTIGRGDSISALSKEFAVKPETILWANADTLQYGPDSLELGQVLSIPPTDGVYYQWKDGDTVDKIATEFNAKPEDILGWPGNGLDLTNPDITTGQWVMVPGGTGVFNYQTVETATRGGFGAAASSCGGGASSRGFLGYPTDNHYLSGNDYYSGHLGIDLAAGDGANIYAADSGVVTMAQGGWNYGYGNVVQIDHGNGIVTLYAHLSQINVSRCQSVNGGELVGLSGATGNAFGAHLHFEVRVNGKQLNPWNYLPPP